MAACDTANDIVQKDLRLREILRSCGPTLVAYSGGVDSAYLAWMAAQVLGRDALAVIADSPSLPRQHLQDALAFAAAHEIDCEVVQTHELEKPEYRRNDSDRCYFCKDELFAVMEAEQARRGRFRTLAYGVNCDDTADFRPGQRAAKEHSVRAPLLEAGLGKSDVRELSRVAGLEVWDRPASACLSSRVAYGIAVTPEVLHVIEEGEEALHRLGFRQVRVRYHGDIVRIEIAKDEMPKALDLAVLAEFTAIFKRLGFKYVTLDAEGYRSGAMNEALLQLSTPGR